MARIQESNTGHRKSTAKKRETENKPPLSDARLLVSEPDYTSYGDWQIKGKCIDF